MGREPGRRYEVLDGMRGIAAIIVMIYHWYVHSVSVINKNAYIAVDFFFILSGFVIMHAYGARLMNGMSSMNYIWRRLIRLYPMAIIGILLGAVSFELFCAAGLCTYHSRSIIAAVINNLVFVPYLNTYAVSWSAGAPSAGQLFPENGALWSVFFEAVASLAFIGLVRLSRPSLMRLTKSCFALVIACGAYYAFVSYRQSLEFGTGWSTPTLLGGFPSVFMASAVAC